MTREEKCILIAQDQGWRWVAGDVVGQWWCGGARASDLCPNADQVRLLPDYFGCLNACREMEKVMTRAQCERYEELLDHTDAGPGWAGLCVWHCSAAERAEAYGLARGLWKEGE